MNHSTGKPTKAEAQRIDRFRWIGCVVCAVFRKVPEVPYDVHHGIDGSRRISHADTAPVCPWHHRGVIPLGYSQIEAGEEFGPSLALSPARFRQLYGSDADLVAMTDALIEEYLRVRAA